MVPNHGLIIMSLLHGGGDFDRSLMMVNTAGWDTDCNSGNVGCILGIRNGLDTFNGGDWRGPVADRLYLSTADGGSAISDAVQETYKIVNTGRILAGLATLQPKQGARFNFSLPGSQQGFQPTAIGRATLYLDNVGRPEESGARSLALRFDHVGATDYVVAGTPTFVPPDALTMPGYALVASPTLYPGQTVRARLSADAKNSGSVNAGLYLKYYGEGDQAVTLEGSPDSLVAGSTVELTWRIPDLGGCPIFEIGIVLRAAQTSSGCVYLDYLTWEGSPDITLSRPLEDSTVWQRAWVDATDQHNNHSPEAYRLVQNRGRGLMIQGTHDWDDYTVSAALTPHMADAIGIAARVQGLQRYYALLICNDSTVQLVKVLDGETVLAASHVNWELGHLYALKLTAHKNQVRAYLDNQLLFDFTDLERPLLNGAIALVCDEGRVGCDVVEVHPVQNT